MAGDSDIVSLRITLRYKDLDEFVSKYAENVSTAGLFLRTKAPKPTGTKIRFELLLADGTRALRGEGVVVTVREDDKPGMALRFNVLDAESQAVVERVVSSNGEGPLAPTPLSTRFGKQAAPEPPARGRSSVSTWKSTKASWGDATKPGINTTPSPSSSSGSAALPRKPVRSFGDSRDQRDPRTPSNPSSPPAPSGPTAPIDPRPDSQRAAPIIAPSSVKKSEPTGPDLNGTGETRAGALPRKRSSVPRPWASTTGTGETTDRIRIRDALQQRPPPRQHDIDTDRIMTGGRIPETTSEDEVRTVRVDVSAFQRAQEAASTERNSDRALDEPATQEIAGAPPSEKQTEVAMLMDIAAEAEKVEAPRRAHSRADTVLDEPRGLPPAPATEQTPYDDFDSLADAFQREKDLREQDLRELDRRDAEASPAELESATDEARMREQAMLREDAKRLAEEARAALAEARLEEEAARAEETRRESEAITRRAEEERAASEDAHARAAAEAAQRMELDRTIQDDEAASAEARRILVSSRVEDAWFDEGARPEAEAWREDDARAALEAKQREADARALAEEEALREQALLEQRAREEAAQLERGHSEDDARREEDARLEAARREGEELARQDAAARDEAEHREEQRLEEEARLEQARLDWIERQARLEEEARRAADIRIDMERDDDEAQRIEDAWHAHEAERDAEQRDDDARHAREEQLDTEGREDDTRLAREAQLDSDRRDEDALREHEAQLDAEQRDEDALRAREDAERAEDARIAHEAQLEDARRAEDALRAREDAERAEDARIAHEAQLEDTRRADDALHAREDAERAEDARIAREAQLEDARRAEDERLAEEARLAQEARLEEERRDAQAREEERRDAQAREAERRDAEERRAEEEWREKEAQRVEEVARLAHDEDTLSEANDTQRIEQRPQPSGDIEAQDVPAPIAAAPIKQESSGVTATPIDASDAVVQGSAPPVWDDDSWAAQVPGSTLPHRPRRDSTKERGTPTPPRGMPAQRATSKTETFVDDEPTHASESETAAAKADTVPKDTAPKDSGIEAVSEAVQAASRAETEIVKAMSSVDRGRAGSGVRDPADVSVTGVGGQQLRPSESSSDLIARPSSRPPPRSTPYRQVIERDHAAADPAEQLARPIAPPSDFSSEEVTQVPPERQNEPAPSTTRLARDEQAQKASTSTADLAAQGTHIVGIDFGGRWARVSRLKNGELELIQSSGSPYIPALVAVRSDGTIAVGAKARTIFLDDPTRAIAPRTVLHALKGGGIDPNSRLTNVKVENGKVFVDLGVRSVDLHELLVAFFTSIRAAIVAHVGDENLRAVISIPSDLDPEARTILKEACKEAKLSNVKLYSEVEALIRAYRLDDQPIETMLMVDVGATHVGLAVARRGRDGFAVVGTRWIDELSASEIDSRVVELTLHELNAQAKEDHRADLAARIRLLEAVERARVDIRRNAVVELKVTLPAPGGASNVGVERSIKLSRSRIYQVTEDSVKQICQRIQELLREVGVHPRALGAVVLAGSGGLYPPLVQAMSSMTTKEPLASVPPAHAFALGLARGAVALERNESAALKSDALSQSVGIQLPGGRFLPLVKTGEPLPAKIKKKHATTRDNQTEIELEIYQGEAELVRACSHLGAITLTGVPKGARGAVSIDMTIEIDLEEVVTVTLAEASSGNRAQVVLPGKKTSPQRRAVVASQAAADHDKQPASKKGGLLSRLLGRS